MKQAITMLSLVVLVTGCATVPDSGSKEDKNSLELQGNRFQEITLQTALEKTLDSLLASHAIGRDRPSIAFASIKNKTIEEIDLKIITEKIRTRLDQSGRVRLTDDPSGETQLKEQDFSSVKNTDKSSRKKFAKLKAAGYRLTAVIDYNRDKNIREFPYQFIISLADTETGELIWAESKLVTKMTKSSFSH